MKNVLALQRIVQDPIEPCGDSRESCDSSESCWSGFSTLAVS